MAKLGLKTFSMAVDKGWEHLPDAAFRVDTYIPKEFQKKKDKKNQAVQDNEQDQGQRQRHHRRSRRRSSSVPSETDDSRSHRRSQSFQQYQQPHPPSQQQSDQRYSSSSNDPYRKDSYDQRNSPNYPPQAYQQGHTGHPHAAYYPATAAATATGAAVGYQPQPQSYSQGDPNFPYNVAQDQKQPQPQPQEKGFYHSEPTPPFPSDLPNNPPYQPPTIVEPPPMSNDQYYQSQAGTRDPGGYHRYNPSDYQPHGYQGSGYQDDRYAQQDDRYAPGTLQTRQSRDPYQRPSSNNYDESARYNDSYATGSSDERRGRDKHKSSKKDRERSTSGSGIHGFMDKNLDTTEKGLAAGGIGALAGGYIGHRFGKGPLATVAGVLLGGIGANVWEGREERRKEEKKYEAKHGHRRTRSEGAHSRQISGYDDEEGNRYYNEPYSGRSRGNDRDYDDRYDSDASYEEDRRPHSRRRDRDHKRSSRRDSAERY